jgi:hypothetical protein
VLATTEAATVYRTAARTAREARAGRLLEAHPRGVPARRAQRRWAEHTVDALDRPCHVPGEFRFSSTALHCTALHFYEMHCTALHCIALQ